MRFFQPFLTLVFAVLALAQSEPTGPNAFKVPSGGYDFAAGSTVTLLWTPTTGNSVKLVLRSGNPGDLTTGTVITPSTPNSGSYAWTIPANTVEGSDYAIEIVSNDDPSQFNFTPPVIITSTNLEPSISISATGSLTAPATPAATTATMTNSGSGTASASASAASSTGSAATPATMSPSPTPAGHHKTTTSDVAVATSTVGNAAPTGRVRGAVAGLVAVGVGAVVVL